MAFDPNFPPYKAKLISKQWRDQFNGLKDIVDEQRALIDAQQAQITALQAENQNLAQQLAARPTAQQVLDLIAAHAARNVDSVAALPPPWSENPPDRAEFNETSDKVNEALSGLKHPA